MKSSTIIIIVVTLIAAAGAYWYFFTGTGNQPPLTATTTSFDSGPQAQFQTLLSELQPISFDTAIFSDARFMALVDLATPVTPETTGRLDPFAPVPGVTGK